MKPLKKNSWEFGLIYCFENCFGKNSISAKFATVLCSKLRIDFCNKTGLKLEYAEKKFILTFSSDFNVAYTKTPEYNELGMGIIIFHYHTSVSLRWKSNKGINIEPSDTNFEEGEMEAWFYQLNIASILKNYERTHIGKGTSINKYSFVYELDVFSWEGTYLQINLKNDKEDYSGNGQSNEINNSISLFFSDWNKESESQNRDSGVVHNVMCTKKGSLFLEYYIDFGSANFSVLTQLLEFLSKTDLIEKLKITSHP